MEEKFGNALLEAVRECKRLKPPYNPTRFLQMLNEHGAVETAKILLSSHDGWQEGFATLILKDRIDLTMESHVVKEQYKALFTKEEIEEAQRRLDSANDK